MKTTGIAMVCLFMATNILFGQTPDSSKATSHALVISGSLDGYYRYNFNHPKQYPYNSATSFTRSSNSFELGMASLRADHNFGKINATIDLGFGTRAEEFSYNDANTRLAVKQAYLSYAPSSKIKFTFGTWATHVGYELVDAYLNRNYSMSYMFTNGPFTHTGLKADISLGEKTAVMVGVSNPTDYRSAAAMPKSFIAQWYTGSKDDRFKVYINFVGGKQSPYKKVIQPDLVVAYAASSKLSVGFNATYQSVKLDKDSTHHFTAYQWWGTAVYINVDPVSWFGLTLRGEYINDKDKWIGVKHVFAPTLSANFKVNNLTIIPELRFDKAGNQYFYKTASTLTASTGSFILAAAYHF